jgi:predicted N-acetyltransferase YhbS
MSNVHNNLIIRKFNKPSDLEYAAYLTKKEGWHSETTLEFKSFYDHDSNGCLLCEVGGVRRGMCIATAYDQSGFIGELIVDNQFRNKGIGRVLMQHAIDYLHHQKMETIFLDGVQKAIPLYLDLGFRSICRSLRFFGQIDPQENHEIRNIEQDDLQRIFEVDREQFGDDRSFFLKKRIENYPNLALVWKKNKKILAYLFARIGVGGWVTVGPWVNFIDHVDQMVILAHLQAKIGNQPFSIGVLENRSLIIHQLVMHGMNPQPDPPSRMILGHGMNPGDNDYCLAIGSPAKG